MKVLGGTFNQEKSLKGAFSFETDGSLAALPRAQESVEMYFQHLLHNGSVRGRQLGKLRHVHNSFGTINKVTGADVHKCTGIIINVINPSPYSGDDCIMVAIDKHTFVLSAQEYK